MPPEQSATGAVEPVAAFAEPWQARAFAIAILASRRGCFTWAEWTQALSRELQTPPSAQSRSGEAHYFDCWLRTLQGLLIGKGAIGQADLRECKQAWEDAYRRTPHGVPVVLADPGRAGHEAVSVQFTGMASKATVAPVGSVA